MTIPYAARLPDHVDDQGFPWWEEDEDWSPAPAPPAPAPATHADPYFGVCAQCGADSMGGVCCHDSEHWA